LNELGRICAMDYTNAAVCSTSVTSSSIVGHARQGWIKPFSVIDNSIAMLLPIAEGTSEGGSEFGLP